MTAAGCSSCGQPPLTVDRLARALAAAAAHPTAEPNPIQERLAERMHAWLVEHTQAP